MVQLSVDDSPSLHMALLATSVPLNSSMAVGGMPIKMAGMKTGKRPANRPQY
jgi:hypothetical protein